MCFFKVNRYISDIEISFVELSIGLQIFRIVEHNYRGTSFECTSFSSQCLIMKLGDP